MQCIEGNETCDKPHIFPIIACLQQTFYPELEVSLHLTFNNLNVVSLKGGIKPKPWREKKNNSILHTAFSLAVAHWPCVVLIPPD